jgi:hypothetical protein
MKDAPEPHGRVGGPDVLASRSLRVHSRHGLRFHRECNRRRDGLGRSLEQSRDVGDAPDRVRGRGHRDRRSAQILGGARLEGPERHPQPGGRRTASAEALALLFQGHRELQSPKAWSPSSPSHLTTVSGVRTLSLMFRRLVGAVAVALLPAVASEPAERSRRLGPRAVGSRPLPSWSACSSGSGSSADVDEARDVMYSGPTF